MAVVQVACLTVEMSFDWSKVLIFPLMDGDQLFFQFLPVQNVDKSPQLVQNARGQRTLQSEAGASGAAPKLCLTLTPRLIMRVDIFAIAFPGVPRGFVV